MNEFWGSLSQQLKPKLHEITAYLIACSCCWLFISHAKLRQALYIIFSGFESNSPFFITIGLVATAGLLLSLVHAFIQRKKSQPEKILMGWFVMGVSGMSSFVLGLDMLGSHSTTLLILPVWNILTGLFMLTQMEMQKYEMSDDNASIGVVFGTTVLLVIILFLTDFGLHLSWALTLSICIFYATTIVFLSTWIVKYFEIQLPDFLK
jgi:hypothetical protein